MLEVKSMKNQIADKNLKNVISDESNLNGIGSGLADNKTQESSFGLKHPLL